MEINAGNSSVNIAISVQPKNEPTQIDDIENNRGYEANSANYAAENVPNPSFNTRGEEVGNVIDAWA